MKAGNTSYNSISEIPDTIPVFPLTGALLLPGGQLPLNIFEQRYINMINDALSSNKIIGMIQPCLKTDHNGSPAPVLSDMGCIGRISAYQEMGDGRYHISLSGICRFNVVEELKTNTDYRQCKVEYIEDDLDEMCQGDDIDRDEVLLAFKNYLDANNMSADWETIEKSETETLVIALCMMSPYNPAEKQALLEAPTLKDRCDTLIAISESHLAKKSGATYGKLQ